jgi:UPF0755 protein
VVRRLLLVVLALGLVAAGGAWWWVQARLDEPYRGFTQSEVFVEVAPGAGIAAIGDQLVASGVVADGWTFRLAARLEGADRRLQAGEYRFAEPASPRAIVARLEAGDIYRRPVTFPEGLTAAQLSEVFEANGLGAAAEFLEAAANTALVAEWDPEAASLEGYLFPDTYHLPRRASAESVVRAMVAGFAQAFDDSLAAAARARGLSVREVVTLASLIEKETAAADERAIVSAVYHNRLRIGMPLQCDPTVIYALMLAGRWDGNIRRADLQIDSPYNTYRYPGLPPGPIAAPGRAALVAAVEPADVTYLYFVSRNDGTHVFANTLAEHNRNVARWQGRRTPEPPNPM